MAYYLCKDTTYFRFTHKTFCSNPALCLKSQIGQKPASDKQDICNFAPNSKNHPTTMKELFLVFLGGGAGSVCRYLASLLIGRNIASAFPWPTLSVNLLGCLLIGLLYTLSERCSLALRISPIAHRWALRWLHHFLHFFQRSATSSPLWHALAVCLLRLRKCCTRARRSVCRTMGWRKNSPGISRRSIFSALIT